MVIGKIMDAFWKDGFEATSLADLMAATDMNKGSLYGAYGNKNAMFQLALLEYDKIAVTGTITLMDGLPGRQALHALLTGPAVSVEADDRRGCLLCNSLSEYSKLDEPARTLTNTSRINLVAAIERALGRIHDGDGHGTKALELMALYFGLRVPARGGVSTKEIRGVGEAALASL